MTSIDVLKEIASIFEVNVSDIVYAQKDPKFIMLRKLYAYVCYKKLGLSMNEISGKLRRTKNYGRVLIYAVSKHIKNNKMEWLDVLNKYTRNSVLYPGLSNDLSIVHRSKMVVCVRTGIEYKSIRDASASLNIKYDTLYGQLTGRNRNKTSLKFKSHV